MLEQSGLKKAYGCPELVIYGDIGMITNDGNIVGNKDARTANTGTDSGQ